MQHFRLAALLHMDLAFDYRHARTLDPVIHGEDSPGDGHQAIGGRDIEVPRPLLGRLHDHAAGGQANGDATRRSESANCVRSRISTSDPSRRRITAPEPRAVRTASSSKMGAPAASAAVPR